MILHQFHVFLEQSISGGIQMMVFDDGMEVEDKLQVKGIFEVQTSSFQSAIH